MFTGIIEGVGRVVSVEETNGGRRLGASADLATDGLDTGESVAVNGACMTVVSSQSGSFVFDVSAESLRRTTLGAFAEGDAVNLERSLKFGDRLGGHIVQGHVDATGRITSSRTAGNSQILRVRFPERMRPYIVEKGFIAVDGISLTVVQKGTSTFTLSVIPFTLENTNLQEKGVRDRVNLEIDIIAKYVESLMAR